MSRATEVACPYCEAFPGEPCIDMRTGWGQNVYGTGSTTVAAPAQGRPLRDVHRERRTALRDAKRKERAR